VSHWPTNATPPAGAPDVVVVVLDDVGFGHLSCYGGDIATPNLDRLAARGLRYTNVHTTGMCAPTRACLLTGRNHHSCGMGIIPDLSTGHPGYHGVMPRTHGMYSEILGQAGFATVAIGKWHLTPTHETSAAGPFDRWPTGRGFDRYYGFLGGETSQHVPQLWRDNSRIDPPLSADYHLTEDLVDEAIRAVGEIHTTGSHRPFLLHFAPGAAHAPHQAPDSYLASYRGMFDEGWDVARARVLQRQKELGIVPAHVDLPERNPGVEAWDELDPDRQRIYARYNEAFAGFLTHTDAQIGRLFEFLDRIGRLDDTLTIVISDNGASGEGGPDGLFNEIRFFNGVDETIDDVRGSADLIGTAASHTLYPEGWAMVGNTPFRFYKQYVFEGGIADPCIVSWPNRIVDCGGLRHQYHHVVDLMPTVLDAAGVEPPHDIDGAPQVPIDGRSMMYSFDAPGAETPRRVQYYEMVGTRGLWRSGWKVVSDHHPGAATGDFENDSWELFHTESDPTELRDLAADHPELVDELVAEWWVQAEANDVLPLDDRFVERFGDPRPAVEVRTRCEYFRSSAPILEVHSANLRNRPHSVRARVDGADSPTGAILNVGSNFGGVALFTVDARLHYVYNFLGWESYESVADRELPAGWCEVGFDVELAASGARCRLVIDDEPVGECRIERLCPNLFDPSPGLTVGRAFTRVSPLVAPPFAFPESLLSVVVHAEPGGPTDRVLEARTAWVVQ
jgi:arylsulfatase